MADTVLSFAQTLGVPVKVLLEHFNRAGVSGMAENTSITNNDRVLLLDHLRSQVKPKRVVPPNCSNIQRLIDNGYVNKKRFRRIKSDSDILDPNNINDLAMHAVRLAYGGDDLKCAQALIELLPRKFQQSLAEWFARLGIPSQRLVISLDGLPNSTWIICRPTNKRLQNKILKTMSHNPVVLQDKETKSGKFDERPWFDDLEIDERGHSVKAYQGGATGLKR